MGQLFDLMVDAADLKKHIPEVEPVFVNLPEVSEAKLGAAGAFGQVLRVVQNRDEKRRAFEKVLGEAVGNLEEEARKRPERWLELLSYLTRLVYHVRPEPEHEPMRELIRESVKKDKYREELDMAQRTIAQAMMAEGAAEGRREQAAKMLLMQLALRFGEVPRSVEQTILTTRDLNLLEEWLKRFATAKSLEEVGIGSPGRDQ